MQDFNSALDPVLAQDPRFPREAYLFVREALDHTQELLVKQGGKLPRHVSGMELLDGIRDLAIKQFGPMAITVFDEWRICRCEDFGEIVFNLVENKILSKTDEDSREDFKRGYDFTETFRRPYLPSQRS